MKRMLRISAAFLAALVFVLANPLSANEYHPTSYSAAQTDTTIVSVSTGEVFVITFCKATTSKAVTVPVDAELEWAGSVKTPCRMDGIPPGGGFALGPAPVGTELSRGSDGDDLTFTTVVPTGGTITLDVAGYYVSL